MIKLLLRTIKNSLGRFIAISLIIMLGTLIFVGVKATGPALNDSLQATVVKHHLSDLEILSSQGFTETELKAVRQVPGAQVEGVLLQNVLGGKNRDVIALYGYQKNNHQNQLILKQGRLPRNQHEIVLDQQARLREGYKIGDYFNLEKNPQLKYQKYRIVGFADSPQYVDHSTRGASNLGTGKVTYFAYVSHLAFRSSVYSGMQVYFPELQNQKMFSNKYQRAVKQKTAQVRRHLTPAVKKRRQSLAGTALTQIEQGKQKLAQSRQKLVAAQQVLKQQGLTNASTMRTLQRQEAKLQQQRRQLDQQAQRVKQALQPSLLYQTRQDLPGFTGYGESSQRIAAIANVFPLFFFLLAGLITFTTVTRMVEEQRGQMGTLKALGYGKGAIVFQYVAYAGLAGISGAAVGAVLGKQLIPRIVLAMYQEYVVEIVKIPVDWRAIALAALLTLLVTIGAATLVSLREVRTTPAALLRPRAPRAAHKIFLERVPGLWRRLRFFQKISYRNLSRAKLRGLMTILGIAGGTALILTGFGIACSIKEAGNQQFQHVLRYDAVVRARQPKDLTSVQNSLKRSAATRATLPVYTAVVQVNQRQKTVRDVTLTVPKNPGQFDQFVRLRDYQSNHSIGLPTRGVVVSPKVARILHVQVGDQIKIRVPNQKTVQVRIAKVVTNYAGNVIYASPSAYQRAFGHAPNFASVLVKTDHQPSARLTKRWMSDNDKILGISLMADQAEMIQKMTKQLGPIVMIFIGLSAILSFVVLYNLNNINIAERLYELSTIKVLGFYNREVTLYVARESIILAIIGILAGFGLGNLLTGYVIRQAETNNVIFPLTIKPFAYLVAVLLMVIFNLIVVYITHRKLQKIDMVAALKSND